MTQKVYIASVSVMNYTTMMQVKKKILHFKKIFYCKDTLRRKVNANWRHTILKSHNGFIDP